MAASSNLVGRKRKREESAERKWERVETDRKQWLDFTSAKKRRTEKTRVHERFDVAREFPDQPDFFNIAAVHIKSKKSTYMPFKFQKVSNSRLDANNGGWILEITSKLGGFFCLQIKPGMILITFKMSRRENLTLSIEKKKEKIVDENDEEQIVDTDELGIILPNGTYTCKARNFRARLPEITSLPRPEFLNKMWDGELLDTVELLSSASNSVQAEIENILMSHHLPHGIARFIWQLGLSSAYESAKRFCHILGTWMAGNENESVLTGFKRVIPYIVNMAERFSGTINEREITGPIMAAMEKWRDCMDELEFGC